MTHTSAARRLALVAGAAALLVNAACYSYQPTASRALRPTSDVHLRVTDEGSMVLQPLVGPDVRQLNGQVQEFVGDSAVVLLLDDVVTSGGISLPWRRGRITVPLRMVASIERRTLDRKRTRAFAIATTATFVAVVVAAIKRAGYSGGSKSGAGGGPPE